MCPHSIFAAFLQCNTIHEKLHALEYCTNVLMMGRRALMPPTRGRGNLL